MPAETAPTPVAVAHLSLDTDDEHAPLAVTGHRSVTGLPATDPDARQHAATLHLWGAMHHPEGPDRDAQDDDLKAGADEELHAHGWTRSGPWMPDASCPVLPGPPRAVCAPLAPRERLPVDGPTQAVLDALWAAWPPAPAREVAVVADVSPRAARAALARLVIAGHARRIGQTDGPRPVDVFAPVGTQWAPDRAEGEAP